jgi:hypothetical protein
VPLASIGGDSALVPQGRELATISEAVGENYEALAVRPAIDGNRFELILVSDDNFSPLQRTLLLELRWRP